MLQHKPLGQQTGLGVTSRLGHRTPLGQSQSLGQTSQQLLLDLSGLDLSEVDWTEMFDNFPNLAQGRPAGNRGVPSDAMPNPSRPPVPASERVSPSDSPRPASPNAPTPSPSEPPLEPITSQKPLQGDRAMVPPRASLVNPLIQESARALNTESPSTESPSVAPVPLFSIPPASKTSSSNSAQPTPPALPQGPESLVQTKSQGSPPPESSPRIQKQPFLTDSPPSDTPAPQTAATESVQPTTDRQGILNQPKPSDSPNPELVQASPNSTSDPTSDPTSPSETLQPQTQNQPDPPESQDPSQSISEDSQPASPALQTYPGDRSLPDVTTKDSVQDSVQLQTASPQQESEPPSSTTLESGGDRPTASEPPSNQPKQPTPPSAPPQSNSQSDSVIIQESQLPSAGSSDPSTPAPHPSPETEPISSDLDSDPSPSPSPQTIAPDIISPDSQPSSTLDTNSSDSSDLSDRAAPRSTPDSIQTESDSSPTSPNLPSTEKSDPEPEANILQTRPDEPTSDPEIALDRQTPSQATDNLPNLQAKEEPSQDQDTPNPHPPVVQARNVTLPAKETTETLEPTAKAPIKDPAPSNSPPEIRAKESGTNRDLPSPSPSISPKTSDLDSRSDSGVDANPVLQSQELESEKLASHPQEPVDKQVDPISEDGPISPKQQASNIQLTAEPDPSDSPLPPSHPQASDPTPQTPLIQAKTGDMGLEEPDLDSTISPKASPSTQTDELSSLTHDPPIQAQPQELDQKPSGIPTIQPLVQPSKFDLSSYLQDERTSIPDESDITASNKTNELAALNNPSVSSWANLEDLINLNDDGNPQVAQPVNQEEPLTFPWESLVESLERIAQSEPQPENQLVNQNNTEAPRPDVSGSRPSDPTESPEDDSEHIKTAEDIEIEESQISILAEKVYIALRQRLILEREKAGITPSQGSVWIDIKTRSRLAYHKGRLRQKDKVLFESLTYDIQSSRIFHQLTQNVYHHLSNRLETLTERLIR